MGYKKVLMRDLIYNILAKGYKQYKGLGTSEGREVQDNINILKNEIQKIAKTFGAQSEYSVGIGRWSAVPWIRVFYHDCTPSAKDGVYIVYLFAANGESVFITLNQGTTDSSSEKRTKNRKIIQEKIDSKQFIKNSGDLSFGDNKNYGEAAIFYKEYKFNNLPSENEMQEDLVAMLNIYKECKEKGLIDNKDEFQKFIQDHQNEERMEENVLEENTPADFKISDFTNNDLYRNYINSLLAKPFVIITGNSGTGKTRIATRFAEYLGRVDQNNKNNYLIVPVGADWTDNTKILGYYNPLANNGTGKYEKTEIVKLIELAAKNPKIPYFLILDEMNLSHVERYFSDFLSKMELVDYSNQEKKVYFNIPGLDALEFPKNLFITGTVNIDETTYMFSPKVLDRANVIEFKPEMRDVIDNLITQSEKNSAISAKSGVAEGFLKLANQVRSGSIPEEIKSVLFEMQAILESCYIELEKYGFEFAYRIIKEIRLFTIATYFTAEEKKTNAIEIADIQILQKILPKIHGNRKQIGDLLEQLGKLFADKGLKNSLKKINQMKEKLSRFQYASFI